MMNGEWNLMMRTSSSTTLMMTLADAAQTVIKFIRGAGKLAKYFLCTRGQYVPPQTQLAQFQRSQRCVSPTTAPLLKIWRLLYCLEDIIY